MRRLWFSALLVAALLVGARNTHAYTQWYEASHAHVSASYQVVHRGFQGMTVSAFCAGFCTASFDLPLDVPSNAQVTGVRICYVTPNVIFSRVELFEVGSPATMLLQVDGLMSSATRACTTIAVPPRTSVAPLGVRFTTVGGPAQITLSAVGLDLQPTTVAAEPPAPPSPAHGVNLAPGFPNPTRGEAVIEFDAEAGDATTLEIHDTAGRRIRTLEPAERMAGRRRVVWDGRDEGGREMAAGAYFYRVVTPRTASAARTLVLLR